ncbi:MAG: IclR family transcriptional regulator [Actinomycetota bacterium]|jgi:IclR family transcriptional regulator, acetate operon repressor
MIQSPERTTSPGDQTLIQSLQRGLRLLEVVGERGRAHAKALANATGIALPTTYHLLRTLVYEGYLVRVDDGSYILGEQLENVATRGRSLRAVPKVREVLRRVALDVGATACLALYSEGRIVVGEVVESHRPPRVDLWPGATIPGHATAVGKCILANLPEEDLRRFLDRHPLQPFTSHTVIDRRYFQHQLSTISDIAVVRQEYRYGVACVGAVVRAPAVLGAVGLALPVERLGRLRTKRESVVEVTHHLAREVAAVDELATDTFWPVSSLAG